MDTWYRNPSSLYARHVVCLERYVTPLGVENYFLTPPRPHPEKHARLENLLQRSIDDANSLAALLLRAPLRCQPPRTDRRSYRRGQCAGLSAPCVRTASFRASRRASGQLATSSPCCSPTTSYASSSICQSPVLPGASMPACLTATPPPSTYSTWLALRYSFLSLVPHCAQECYLLIRCTLRGPETFLYPGIRN